MAFDWSTCSVFPSKSCASKCDNKSPGISFSSCEEVGRAYWCGRWDSLDLPCLSDWEIGNIFEYGDTGDVEYLEWSTAYDPISQLPDDPFEQNGGCDITAAAIAAGFVRIGANTSYYGIDGNDVLACHHLGEALLYSPESHLSKGDLPDCYWDETSALSIYEAQAEVFESVLDIGQVPETSCNGANYHEDGLPHEGLTYALGYLGIKDLLSVERVCRSLHSVVRNDSLLWRCIHIDSSFSEKLTDDVLLQLTRRAQGNLQCLSLKGCSRITDEGLRHVLENNPKLRKLSVPECVRLSLDGIITSLKVLHSAGRQGVSSLKLGRLFSVSEEQFAELKFLLGVCEVGQAKARKPLFYHLGRYSPTCDDECPIDIDFCPLCQKYKLVYDCPSDSCQAKGSQQCRACDVCIARCMQCGKCIKDSKYVETFFLEYQCSDCWKNPPLGLEVNKEVKE